jgi:hypothetical protein
LFPDREVGELRRVKQSNFSFFAATGSGFFRDKHVIRAFIASPFRGESPANFRAVNNIEIHRGAFILQLLKARQLFEISPEMTHDIKRHSVFPHDFRVLAIRDRDAAGIIFEFQN